MQPPSPQARPREVRAYLANILIQKHDVNPEAAESMIDRWQLGRGRDLRQANSIDFVNLFGKQVGWYLYRSFQEDLNAEWRSSTSGIITYYALRISCVTPFFFLARARYSLPDRQQAEDNLLYALFCGPIIMIASIRELNHNAEFSYFMLSFVGIIMTLLGFVHFCSSTFGRDGEAGWESR